MESHLVAEFIERTRCDASIAYNILQAKGWDLNVALQAYFALENLNEQGSRWSVPSVVIEENGNVAESTRPSYRPPLQKTDAVEITDCKKLARGISRATDNVNLVSKARCNIAHDFVENTVCSVNQYFIETPVYTFTLPDLTCYSEDFRRFLEKDLIEISSLVSLEQAGRLNWWAEAGICQRLWPLATTGDGNCLLHAASLGMWGFHDRLLTLRKALHGFLTGSSCRDALWRRWRWQQTKLNAEAGFVYSEEEWTKEWCAIVNMASTQPRVIEGGRRRSMAVDPRSNDVPENATYESLEEIHVLALAHVLRRTIVVVADLMLKDVNGEDLAPILFGGVYLPLECKPSDCHRSPLVLTYDGGHFSALVAMETSSSQGQLPTAIPLTDVDYTLLPLQFVVDPGDHYVWEEEDPINIRPLTLSVPDKLVLLESYLDLADLPCAPSSPPGHDLADEEEIDKRFTEVLDTDSSENLFNNRSKAAKQLQSVAKQFGSIGKSMGKKLKHLGSIGKLARSNSEKKASGVQTSKQGTRQCAPVLCALLRLEKRHEYQAEMIRNYIQSARARFQRESASQGKSPCINPGCQNQGTALTSYMCRSCYDQQREREKMSTNINSPSLARAYPESTAPRYGTGRSHFYTESDTNSHEVVSRLPSSRGIGNVDHTLYLSKSTFYNDNQVGLYTDELDMRGRPGIEDSPGPSPSPRVARRVLANASPVLMESHTRKQSSPTTVAREDSPVIRVNAGRMHSGGGVLGTSPRVQSYNLARNWESAPSGRSSQGAPSLESAWPGSLPRSATIGGAIGGTSLPQVDTVGAQTCRTNSCPFFGNPETDYLCSKCHKELLNKGGVKSLRVSEVKR